MPKSVLWAISFESLEELFRENFSAEESPELNGVAIDEVGGTLCLSFRLTEEEAERLAQICIENPFLEYVPETEIQLN